MDLNQANKVSPWIDEIDVCCDNQDNLTPDTNIQPCDIGERLPSRALVWETSGVIYVTMTTHTDHQGTAVITLRQCYDWLKAVQLFDHNYEVVIDLPKLQTTITNDAEWALAFLSYGNT